MMVEVYSTRLRAPGAGPVVETRAPDVQSGFNAVAGALSDAAQTLRRADQASQLTDARRTVLEGYAAAEADLENDQDWLGMEGRQNERLTKIREEALGKIGYESLRDEFALDLDRQGFAHIGNVRRRAFGLQKDHTLASLETTLDLYRQRAAKLDDPAALNALLDDAQAAISDVHLGGFLSEAEAGRLRTAQEDGVFGDYTARLVQGNPEGALQMLETPGALPIDEQTRLTALTRAQGEIDRRRAIAEAAEVKLKISAEQAINEALNSTLVGLPPTPEREAELLAVADAAGESHGRRMRRTLRDVGLNQRLALMSSDERNETVLDLLRRGSASPEDTIIFGKAQDLHLKISDAEERASAAALKDLEQEQRQAQREHLSYLKEMEGVAYGAAKAGALFPWEEAAQLFAGTEREEAFQEILAMKDAFENQRGASGSFEAQTSFVAAASSIPATSPRRLQFVNDYTSAAEKDLNALGADLRKDVEAQIDALKKGVRRGDYDAVMARVSSQDPDLARELGSYETLWAQTRYHEVATAAEIFPRTEAGGMPAPTNEAGVLGYLRAQSAVEKLEEQERTDPLATPAAQAVLSPFDVTDPRAVATRAIEAQAFFAARLGPDEWGNPREPVLMTKDERAREKERIANLPSSEQAQIWRSIPATAGPYTRFILHELEAPDAVQFMAEGLQAGVSPYRLTEVTQGLVALSGEASRAPKLPNAEDQRSWTTRVVGDFFVDRPEDLGRVMETAKAIFARRAPMNEEPSRKLWEEAVQAAVGGDGENGGMRHVAGRLIPLPPSVSARQAETALNLLATRHAEALGSGRRDFLHPETGGVVDGVSQLQGLQPVIREIPPPSMSSVWSGITSNGAAPLTGGQPVEPDTLENLSLRPVAGGYELEYGHRGEFYRLEDPQTGGPLVVKLEDLVRRR